MLYAMSGGSDDYAYSLHSTPEDSGEPRKKKIVALTLECGDEKAARCFQPDFDVRFPLIEKEVHCALLYFLLHISRTT